MPERGPTHESQLAFEFPRKVERPPPLAPVRGGILADFDSREPGLGRFIRSVEHDVQIQTPAMAAEFLLQQVFTPFDEFTQEELVTLMLNTKNQITHVGLIYRGTINAIHVRNAEVFRPAILANARSIMLAHNHPSGDPTPSSEDVRFNESCVEAGRILDVDLLDHIVVGRDRWVSLKERRLGFDG